MKLPFQGISVTSFVCNLSAKKRKTKPWVYFDGSAPDDSRILKPALLTYCHTILAGDVNRPPLPMASCCTHNSRGEFSQMQTIIRDRSSWKYEGSFPSGPFFTTEWAEIELLGLDFCSLLSVSEKGWKIVQAKECASSKLKLPLPWHEFEELYIVLFSHNQIIT